MITSVHNSQVKNTLELREAKARRASGLMLIDGLREIGRALDAGVELTQVYYCPSVLKEPLPPRFRNVFEVSPKVLEKMTYGDRADGILAVAKVPARPLAGLRLPADPLLVVLEKVEKPGNLGAILRTCDAAGVAAMLVGDPKTDIFNPNVIRASTGAVFSVPVVAGRNEDILAFLRHRNIPAVGAFPGAKDVYTRANFKGPLAIVLGAEDEGLSRFWIDNCRTKVRIPMKGAADSLNVSVCAAVLMFEALRQRSL